MATSSLRKLQIGKETTWGTAVPATAILARVTDASVSYEQEILTPKLLGSLGPGVDGIEVARDVSASITQLATYEQMCYWLDSTCGTATPSGTASPYTYTYTGPTTTAPTPSFWTLEYGPPSNVYEIEGAIVSGWQIAIDGRQPWEVSVDLLGQVLATSTITGALSESAVNVIQGLTTLHIDALGGTIGTTAVTASLISANLSYETGRHTKRYVDAIEPASWGEGDHTFTLEATAEFTSGWKAYLDAMLANPISKAVQLVTTSGTLQAKFGLYGVFTAGEMWSDRDGNVTMDFTLTGRYDTTNAKWFTAEFKHALATMP